MRDFIVESIKDLSIGLIIASVITILIEQKAITGASIVFFIGIMLWTIAFKIKGGES
jgi:hypothetical protein